MAVHADIMKEPTKAKRRDGTGHEIGYANYKEAVDHRSEIEEQIGLSLAKNAELTNIAAKITKNVGARSYRQLGAPARDKVNHEMDTFGGARAFQEGWGTLGASVFAVMNEIEQDSETKTHYSISHAENHPYFPKDKKKPEFDEPLASLNWENLPKGAKQSLAGKSASPFTKLPVSTYDELDFKGKLTLLKGFRYDGGTAHRPATTLLAQAAPGGIDIGKIRDSFDHPDDDEKRQDAINEIREAIKKTDDNKKKAQLGALLDIVVDRHTSGDNTNLVRRKGDGGVKDQWIEDTVKAGKPIISGPSGHTLRYLNFWAEKRKQEKEREGGNITDWPSLEAARLVMMANLMPPKHHSYDEIMTASIGIKDEAFGELKYENKSSYLDLATHKKEDAKDIADKAYDESGAVYAATDFEVENEISDSINDRKDKQDAINNLVSKLSKVSLHVIERITKQLQAAD